MSAILNFIRENHILAIIEQINAKKKSRLCLNAFDIVDVPLELASCLDVEHLYLHRNEIVTIPVEITHLTNLTTLTLDYNNISSLPPEIKNLNKLVNLNISYNPLKILLPEIGDLENLEAFWCNRIGLCEIPKEIGKLTKLDTFGARGNELRSLPEEMTKLTKLRWLTLENNQIESLPNMEGMQSLIHCNLRRNRLKELPQSFLKCPDLMYLQLNNNQISAIPEDLDASQSSVLEIIDLRENPICGMPHPDHPFICYNDETVTEPTTTEIPQSSRGPIAQALAINAMALRLPAAPVPRRADPPILDVDFDASSIESSEDWENSVNSSELDLQYQSDDEIADNEAVGMVLPELSRYASTAS